MSQSIQNQTLCHQLCLSNLQPPHTALQERHHQLQHRLLCTKPIKDVHAPLFVSVTKRGNTVCFSSVLLLLYSCRGRPCKCQKQPRIQREACVQCIENKHTFILTFIWSNTTMCKRSRKQKLSVWLCDDCVCLCRTSSHHYYVLCCCNEWACVVSRGLCTGAWTQLALRSVFCRQMEYVTHRECTGEVFITWIRPSSCRWCLIEPEGVCF